MNFFEQEFKKIFTKNNPFEEIKFIGKVCYGTLGEKTRMKLEFVILGTYQKYEGIKATILDKTEGTIDSLTLKFSDIWGKKKINNPHFKDGIEPYIWIYNNKAEWYAYDPTYADYKELAGSIKAYAELFIDQAQELKNSYNLNQQM